jgi:uncharacterized membrane-anchored protein
MRGASLVFSLLLFLSPLLHADDPAPHLSSDQLAQEASALGWKTGTITLKDGLAKIDLQPGWRFLDGDDAEKVLHDFWGNPPQDPPLGMIFPPDLGPMDRNAWAVLVAYEEEGHVNDSDASKINYGELLKTMQQSVRDANPEREKMGYPGMELVGWAEPPHYDAATHKLYWAKTLHEIGAPGSGLNYNIRVLGRKGVLVLNAIADVRDLGTVSAQMPRVMAMVDFQPGNTYAEFDPKVDKVAAYGIAGLVAGTAVAVAAKAGLLKFMFPLLLAAKKFIIIIVVAIVAAVKKIGSAIRGKSSVARPFEHPQDKSDPPPPNPGGGFPPTKSF